MLNDLQGPKLHDIEWSRIVVDEMQLIKNPSSKTTAAVLALKLAPNGSFIALSGKSHTSLTKQAPLSATNL
jgi:SNF2 family DNA or RNA helicase